jgi:hypothetical protein
MKKLLLTLSAAALCATVVSAQRLTLYEEFSGENCAPCAATNPGLWTLITAPGNDPKIMLIKYQVPIPSAGPIYNLYPTVAAARRTYYGVNSAPNGRIDGAVSSPSSSSPGHPYYLSQTEINNAAAVATPFAVTVSHAWNATGDSITANVSITANSAFSATGSNLKLRVALLEHLSYCVAPGTNGETEFHNIVREMYPDANGTTLPATWTASQNQTYTIKGKVPTWLDKSNGSAIVVVWIQNDADKSIAQAAKSTLVPLVKDAGFGGCPSGSITCATGTTGSANTVATLKNTGTTTLTSATIFYKVDNGTYSSFPWTGSLAPGATVVVSIPAVSLSGVGSHKIYDSVGVINGSAEINTANNTIMVPATFYNKTAGTMPLSTDLESGLPTNMVLHDVNGNGQNWVRKSGAGYNSSSFALYHNNYNYSSGEVNYALLPTVTMPAGVKTLDFYYAYAQYASENDKLDVVYSSDCGSTWTTLWSAQGATLATHPAQTASFVPGAGDWKLQSVNVNSVPNGAMLAFRATSDFGNNLYIDNINLMAGVAAGVNNVITSASVSLYPNPAKESATLSFKLNKSSKVVVNILDAVGRTISTVANTQMSEGAQQIAIPTSNLASGMYNVSIHTEAGTVTKALSVIK